MSINRNHYSPLEMQDLKNSDYPGANAGMVVTKDPAELSRFGQITYKAEVGQVTIRCPIKNEGTSVFQCLLSCIAIFYGYTAFIIPGVFGIYGSLGYYYKVKGSFFFLYGAAISMACVIVNEIILKPILKQPRPSQSAAFPDKPGMPSGHVLNAYTLMAWALLELYNDNTETPIDFYPWYVIIIALNAPVPWARWYNFDHKLSQVFTSGLMSIAFGYAAYLVRTQFFPDHLNPWDWIIIPAVGKEDMLAAYSNASDDLHDLAGRIGERLKIADTGDVATKVADHVSKVADKVAPAGQVAAKVAGEHADKAKEVVKRLLSGA